MITIESSIHILKIIATVAIFFVWFIRYDNIKKEFSDYNFPSWFRDLIGILKISFMVMLHSPNQEIVIIGSLGIFILMIGAVLTHIRMKNNFRKYIASLTMCIISALILYFSI